MVRSKIRWFAIVLLGSAGACRSSIEDTAPIDPRFADKPSVPDARIADAIYLGGDVITMNDAQPLAEAVAIADGIVISVGTRDEVMRLRGDETRMVRLEGKTLLPGFVDSHGHAFMIGLQASTANLLPPPDGGVSSIDGLVETLTEWIAQNKSSVDRVGWIIGFGYDNAQLAEQRHPTREDLDRVSTELPVLIIHQSGHVGSVNSKGLELAGITAASEDPPGGKFGRLEGSNEPSGYAEEYGFFLIMGAMAQSFDEEVADLFVVRGTQMLASFGYTTGQEGRAVGMGLDAMERMANAGRVAIDLVAYPDILEVEDIVPSMEYLNRYRIGGAKLTIDGSPQGKTAWLTEPYFVPPAGQKEDYAGYAAITVEQTREAVEKAFANGWQILTHANGDAAIDSLISAVSRARKKYPDVENRPVLIHGQTLRHDQVAKLDELDIFPSLFPMHTFYWGDYHRDSVLGPERAENISPTRWVLDRGMIFGSHHDAPVALPDSMRVLSATVTRRSRSGDILGPHQRVTVMEGLKSLTLWPAWQHFEESTKGSIEPGKLADFVVLSANPLEVSEDALADLQIIETIKEGESIYVRGEDASSMLLPPPLGLTAPHDHAHDRHWEEGLRAQGCDGCVNPAVHGVLHLMAEGLK